jgi:hypothetical protein
MEDIEFVSLAAAPEPDKWTVYGRVRDGLDGKGVVQMKGLHLDRAPSLEMANSFVEDAIATYNEACVECVIVHLKGGKDTYGTRRIVRRVSNGKAWWE